MTPGMLAVLASNSHCAEGANVSVPKLMYSEPKPLSVPMAAPDPSSSVLFAAVPPSTIPWNSGSGIDDDQVGERRRPE